MCLQNAGSIRESAAGVSMSLVVETSNNLSSMKTGKGGTIWFQRGAGEARRADG
jgi:hypothetical protein